MRTTMWAAVLAAVVISSAIRLAAADITYRVFLKVGTATVSGVVVTDGTAGVLGTSNILSWDLVLNDGTKSCQGMPCVVQVTGPCNLCEAYVGGSDLTATDTQLLFNFSGTDRGTFFLLSKQQSSGSGWVCFETWASCSKLHGAGELLFIDPFGDYSSFDFPFTGLHGTIVIARAES